MTLPEGLSLRGRVALVTGGARGIGRACALRLAEAGADVAVNYLHTSASASEVAEAVARFGGRGLTLRADVSQPAEAEALVRAVWEQLGGLDILICNAGIWEGAPVEAMDEALWDRVIDINLKGTWAVCRAAMPSLQQGGWGRVVIISSTAGQRGEALYANYAAAKGGQLAFTKSLALELAPYGVTVNAVAPGWVETEMTAAVFADPAQRREIEHTIPVGRIATADDVAAPVLFLCSEWARHITGEVLNVNGGSVLCG
jgi:3-oxoacyl-[acyl-carrier protein] reductase